MFIWLDDMNPGRIIHHIKSRSYLIGVVLLILILDLIINILIVTFAPQVFIKSAEDDSQVAYVEMILPTSTPTAFKPLQPTNFLPAELPAQQATETATPVPEPATQFYGIDFQPGNPQVIIQIRPNNKQVNGGKPIVIRVRPGGSCYYEDHRACIGAFLNVQSENVVFVTVHSGMGGEAESYRRAVEGRGLNRAAYSLRRIKSNLEHLNGAQVTISQGERVLEDFLLLGTTRIPSTWLSEYFRLPVKEAYDLSSTLDPSLNARLVPDEPMLVFETCGWKLPSEPWSPGVTSTTASIYLGVIQRGP